MLNKLVICLQALEVTPVTDERLCDAGKRRKSRTQLFLIVTHYYKTGIFQCASEKIPYEKILNLKILSDLNGLIKRQLLGKNAIESGIFYKS